MSYFIIIRGPLVSGKTTISKQLSKLLNAEHIFIDKVLDENKLDKVDPKADRIPVENFIKANEIILPTAKEKFSKGQIVIFDGCFYYKEPIEHLIKNLPYPHYEFTLKVSVEECIKRDSFRNLVYGEDATRAVYNMVSRFDYGKNIDVSGDLDSAIKQILFFLPK
jgi:tRNA uridine 5-carbamoylmethylation protein Kti12